MVWRLARGLEKLRQQVNARHPNRLRTSDGTIGDRAHAARASDHNPRRGVVHALDLTHSPTRGFDAHAMAERIRVSKDPRVSYVISNGRIFSSTKSPWTWRRYAGSNPHRSHVHVSIRDQHADNTRDWSI